MVLRGASCGTDEGVTRLVRLALAPLLLLALVGAADREDLQRAIAAGDVDGVRELVEERPTLLRSEMGVFGASPLAFAVAKGGDAEVVRYLIARGLDVGEQIPSTGSLLHHASRARNAAVVDVLVEQGLDVNQPTPQTRDTPLHLATYRGNLRVMVALIARGADLNAPNRLGRTPLHLAARNGCRDAVQLLLLHGADPLLVDLLGEDAATAASSMSHGELARTIREFRTGELDGWETPVG